MKKYAAKQTHKGKTAYRTPSRVFNNPSFKKKTKPPYGFGGSSPKGRS